MSAKKVEVIATFTAAPVIPAEPEISKEGTIDYEYATLELDGVIYINQYVTTTGFEGIDLEKNGGLLVWTEESRPASSANAVHGNGEIDVQGMEWSEAHGAYLIRMKEIVAKELGDDIYYRAYVKVGENEYKYADKALKYSVKTYCTNQLNNTNIDEGTKNVCAALLNYGAAAQTYFGYKTDKLVTSGMDLSGYDLSFSEEMLSEASAPSNATLGQTLSGTKSGINLRETSLSLLGAIVINAKYDVSLSGIKSAYAYFWNEDDIGEVTSLGYEANSYSYKVPLVAENGTLHIATSDYIVAKNLGKSVYYVVYIETEDGTVYRSGLSWYSPEQYIGNMHGKDAGLDPLLEAMTVYGEKARLKFAE